MLDRIGPELVLWARFCLFPLSLEDLATQFHPTLPLDHIAVRCRALLHDVLLHHHPEQTISERVRSVLTSLTGGLPARTRLWLSLPTKTPSYTELRRSGMSISCDVSSVLPAPSMEQRGMAARITLDQGWMDGSRTAAAVHWPREGTPLDGPEWHFLRTLARWGSHVILLVRGDKDHRDDAPPPPPRSDFLRGYVFHRLTVCHHDPNGRPPSSRGRGVSGLEDVPTLIGFLKQATYEQATPEKTENPEKNSATQGPSTGTLFSQGLDGEAEAQEHPVATSVEARVVCAPGRPDDQQAPRGREPADRRRSQRQHTHYSRNGTGAPSSSKACSTEPSFFFSTALCVCVCVMM